MARGVFISFEGSEGCGKSTQIQRLADRLRHTGHRVLVTREPGGTEIGEQLRHLLQHSKAGYSMAAETELLLFTASRAQLVREVIVPALSEGTMVLADRFLDSTTVYQGVARRLDPAQVALVNGFAVGLVLPNATFVLDLDPDEARRRMLQRTLALDRMESQPAAFYEAVRAGYKALAAENPQRVRMLDGNEPIETLASKIWEHVSGLLSNKEGAGEPAPSRK
jgi:dTMP kinase